MSSKYTWPEDHSIPDRWTNQQEAFEFAMEHDACMLDMEMGTGKTRVAIDVAMAREDVHKVLVVCPKAVMQVWPRELIKYCERDSVGCFTKRPGWTVKDTAFHLYDYIRTYVDHEPDRDKHFVVLNYESTWRDPMGDYLRKVGFDMVVLDESHRAKSAGSKVSKYLALLGKSVKYRMCLSGTPMANSPLDVYGQYRFLDRRIFGTNYDRFQQRYAIMGGPERRFVVGFKDQRDLLAKFRSIAYTCKMSDVADRIKLPDALPPVCIPVDLPARDMRTLRSLGRDFVAECGSGFVTASNVLVKMLRMQQIAAGFCPTQDGPMAEMEMTEVNSSKHDALVSVLDDLNPNSKVVVFCVFQHDLATIAKACVRCHRQSFELSGKANELEAWKSSEGGSVMVVQIQAGAEGVDMTCATHAIYFSLPHSLALYDQSKARIYRPGQTRPVSFLHLVARDTIDEGMYNSLIRKKDVIAAIKDGTFDMGYMK